MSACNVLTVLSARGGTRCMSAGNNFSKNIKTRSLAVGGGDFTVFKDPEGCFKAEGNNLFFMSGSDKAGRTGHKSEQFPAALEKFAAGSCLWGIRAKISALLVYEERTNDAVVWSISGDAFPVSSWFFKARREITDREENESEGKALSSEKRWCLSARESGTWLSRHRAKESLWGPWPLMWMRPHPPASTWHCQSGWVFQHPWNG